MWKKLWAEFLTSSRTNLSFYLQESYLRFFTLVLGITMMATQLAMVSYYIHQVTDTQGIIRAIDTDAGAGIETAIKTQLYNDNGWRSYGPTTYRIVRIMNLMSPSPLHQEDLPKDENIERQHHFLLLLSSYFGLVALCLLISVLLFQDWGVRLLATSILTGAFCASWLWSEMILRVHPDHFFAFTTALATLATWKFFIKPEDRPTFLLAIGAWALAASTKMTLILFAPAVLIFLYPFKKEIIWSRTKSFLGIGLLVYFIICFPQGIRTGIFKFLFRQKRNVLMADWEFVKVWIDTFAEQMQRAPWVLLVLVLLLPLKRSNEQISFKKYFIFAGFFILPVLALFSRKITVAHEWYAMPFISSIFIVAAIGISLFYNQILAKWIPTRVDQFKRSPWYLMAMFAIIPQMIGIMPEQMNTMMKKQLSCRAEAREVNKRVNAVAASGGHVLADPYIPYSQKYHDKELLLAFEMSPKLITEKTQMIALKSIYYRIYLPPEENGIPSVIGHIENWPEHLAFYRLFNNKNETIDPQGAKWVKTYSDNCTWELWERAQK